MKKVILVSLLSIGIISLQSCKKETEVNNENLVEAAPEENYQELPTQTGPLTSLALSGNHYDFGDVKKGEVVEHIYEVTNTGDNPLIISEVKPTCGCTVPEFTKEPIKPGQKGQITLRFDSTNFEGIQQKQTQIFANVETSPILITFTANVIK